MKRLPVTASAYIYIEKSFREWLEITGYADNTVYAMPNHIREFLHYLETKGKSTLHDITVEQIKCYYHDHLKGRTNYLHKSGSISSGHLNKQLQALRKFCDYLRQTGKLPIAKLDIRNEEEQQKKIDVLTVEEIKQLYAATYVYNDGDIWGIANQERIGMRDRAMLSIFYGCGMRRNEGVQLLVDDIHFEKQYIHVKKGKNYKERLVPINKTNLQYIQEYLYDARPFLLKGNRNTEAFFISAKATKADGYSLLLRLKVLIQKTGNATLQQKEVGLHILRHSIATHLLQSGVSLENIAKFLGHASLESTQIYTHFINEEL
ncbi:MAG: tyrosine-type recombinase/integrase [Verrucomicrobia bacterium]|nr:tyrosine-type recombinase/integrase [Verrucomicrobiota bacterium]